MNRTTLVALLGLTIAAAITAAPASATTAATPSWSPGRVPAASAAASLAPSIPATFTAGGGIVGAVGAVPYGREVPAFPRSVAAAGRRGSYALTRHVESTVRVFPGSGWAVPDGIHPAMTCGDSVWFVRWRSANPDVLIDAAVGDIIAGNSVLSRIVTGGAGYLAGRSCVGPMARFHGALSGNRSTLADVYYELQVWTFRPRI